MTAILPARAAILDTITLAAGTHQADSDEMCVMECVAYVTGEPWGDYPQCVSPVIAAFLRSWNDALPEAPRTALLLPLVPLVIGTRTTAADEATRAWMVTDWLARVQTPAWLRLAGLTQEAIALESLEALTDATTARSAEVPIDAARHAARDAARDAARAAACAALAPTVAVLQASAVDLVMAMCAVGRDKMAVQP